MEQTILSSISQPIIYLMFQGNPEETESEMPKQREKTKEEEASKQIYPLFK